MHIPVLLNQVIEYLAPKPNENFIDAMINGGGHALEIIERIKPNGMLLGIEWDLVIFAKLKSRVSELNLSNNLILINRSYTDLKKSASEQDFQNVKGILFDLGMSSWHIEESGRGFTFQKDEPLDMRYSPTHGNQTAAEIVNRYSEAELAKIIGEYGEERFSRSIARGIVRARKEKPIMTTFQLIETIKTAIPYRYRQPNRIHFATRTFQAIRIAVNHELENIESGLNQALEILDEGGRLVIISFHSLEDRIVKNFFRDQNKLNKLTILTKKPIRAGRDEENVNPRARSAKMRVAEKN